MAAQTKQGYRLTQEHYAYIYAVNPNTISRWQQRKLPLDDPRKLMAYITGRSSCPVALKRKGGAAVLADYKLLVGD